MTDCMFGPTLKLSHGGVRHTRLFALLDDGSRVLPHAQYYDSEKLSSFLDGFRQGLARRGFPEKLYTDQGKIFTSSHLQVVGASLGVRLCHAKPSAAWSRGKIERWFRTLQEDFEARLALDPVHRLEALNARLWRWIEREYPQRPHSSLEGQSPAERFVPRALNLRTADPQTDWERRFLSRGQRPVRLDATISLEGSLWEVPVHRRGRLVQLRLDPFAWRRVEIWLNETFVGLARRCDKQLNSKTYTDRAYDRPDKSARSGHRFENPLGGQPSAFRAGRGHTLCLRKLPPTEPAVGTVGRGAFLRPPLRPAWRGQDAPDPTGAGRPARPTLQDHLLGPFPGHRHRFAPLALSGTGPHPPHASRR